MPLATNTTTQSPLRRPAAVVPNFLTPHGVKLSVSTEADHDLECTPLELRVFPQILRCKDPVGEFEIQLEQYTAGALTSQLTVDPHRVRAAVFAVGEAQEDTDAVKSIEFGVHRIDRLEAILHAMLETIKVGRKAGLLVGTDDEPGQYVAKRVRRRRSR